MLGLRAWLSDLLLRWAQRIDGERFLAIDERGHPVIDWTGMEKES